jgi:hypothetical protein
MDRMREALAHAERAVTLRPDSAGARNNLGNILRTMGRRDDAIAQYETALKIDPNSSMAHYNFGVALRGETRIAEAREHFAWALALRPDFLEAGLALCMAELPALYKDTSEIAERRAAYASQLARLSAEVEGAGAPAAIGSFKPCMARLSAKSWLRGTRRLSCQSLRARTSRSGWGSSAGFSGSTRTGRFRSRDGSRSSTGIDFMCLAITLAPNGMVRPTRQKHCAIILYRAHYRSMHGGAR